MYVGFVGLADLAAAVHQRVDAEGLAQGRLLQRLQHPRRRVHERRLFEVAEDDELVVLGLGIHAVEGLDVFRLEDGVVRVVEILFAEDLHN